MASLPIAIVLCLSGGGYCLSEQKVGWLGEPNRTLRNRTAPQPDTHLHDMSNMKFPVSAVSLFVLLAISGCSRVVDEPFSVAKSVAELPELHQQVIQRELNNLFGTPSHPKLSIPASESDPDEEADFVARFDEILNVDNLVQGASVYRNRCAGCHGIGGAGDGPAAEYLQPKPRDYRKGIYKFTSTPYGQRPARHDLVRTIRRGAKGTSMPAFAWMSQQDLDAVVDYVIYLSLRGTVEEYVAIMSDDYEEDEAIDLVEFNDALDIESTRWLAAESQIVRAASAEPAYDEASIRRGRTLFISSSCYQCHGEDAQGQTEWLSAEFLAAQADAPDGEREKINYDAWGDPAPAADITARMLHGGRRPIDIYRRIYTGINGTPMPAFEQLFVNDPDAIWHLVHYVTHIVDGGEPTLGVGVKDVNPPTDSADESAHPSGDDVEPSASSSNT